MRSRGRWLALKFSAFVVALGPPAGFLGYLYATHNFATVDETLTLTGGAIFGGILLIIALLKHFKILKLKNIFSIDVIMMNLGILFFLLTPVITMVSGMFVITGGSLLIGRGLSAWGDVYGRTTTAVATTE